MEIAAQSLSSSSLSRLSFVQITNSGSFSTRSHCYSVTSLGYSGVKGPCLQQRYVRAGIKAKATQNRKSKSGLVHVASESAAASSKSADDDDPVWLLEPVGDGDWRHIGVKVPMPGTYEIVSSSVTIGRVRERADLVIPVATVSGLHARIQKRGGELYITDLNSTNGTFVNERRVNPGEILPVLPGNLLTFGDTHLAIFRVSKMENFEVKQEGGGEEDKGKETTAQTQGSLNA